MPIWWMIPLFLILILLSIPIVFSIGICCLVYFVLVGLKPTVIALRVFTTLDTFTFLAIPFFLLAGNLMNTGGITIRILSLAKSLVGHLRGGLGQVNIVASMIFAGLSGSAVADAAGLGSIEMEMMSKSGYPKDFSAAVTLASSTIGPIIPPSIVMVIYALSSNASIGRLLVGGLVPGTIMGVCLMGIVYFISRRRRYPRGEWAGFKKIVQDFLRTLIPLLTPVILIGGILSGLFTVTEASAIASTYALILGLFVYRELNWRKLIQVFLDTALTTALIGMVIGISGVFSWILAKEGVPEALASFILSLTSNRLLVLLLLNISLLILGCFVDAGPLIIIVTPTLVPLLGNLNIDLVHFGIIMCINVIIGTITPPVGGCLYAVSGITALPIERLSRAVFPFLLPLIVALFIVTYIPQLTLFLPNLLFD